MELPLLWSTISEVQNHSQKMLAAQEISPKHFGRVNTAPLAYLLCPRICQEKEKKIYTNICIFLVRKSGFLI
jgi:hypothetical protein